MNFRNTLDEQVHKYIEKLAEVQSCEKLAWNIGGDLYSLVIKDGSKKSLFVACLEKEQLHYKEMFDSVFEATKNDIRFIRCEKIECIEQRSDSQIKGYYIFILMEALRPMMHMIMDEEYVSSRTNDNRKKIQLLSHIIGAGEMLKTVNEKFSQINMMVNNDEIYIDAAGNAKLLVYDMIVNQITTKNQVYELEQVMNFAAEGLNVCIDLSCKAESLSSWLEKYKNHLEQLEEKEKNDESCFKQNYMLAEKGNKKLFSVIGYMYEKGRGVDVNYKQAIIWYQKGIETGDSRAMNNLAHMYQKGYGVDKDYHKAIDYLIMAAKKRNATAQFNLGMAYQLGKGVERNKKQAMYWYKKAAKNGNRKAKVMYDELKKN